MSDSYEPELQIAERTTGNIHFVDLRGDVDLSTVKQLSQIITDTVKAAAQTSDELVAVDLREVPFIDSAGLALMVEMRKQFETQGRFALIVAAQSQPERVLKLGRFDTFLRLCYAPEELSAAA